MAPHAAIPLESDDSTVASDPPSASASAPDPAR